MCTVKARSDPPGMNWMRGSERCLSPGGSPWRRRSSPAGSTMICRPETRFFICTDCLKNDRIDAGKIADCLRCAFLPECHMAPTAIRDRRRVLRYRNPTLPHPMQRLHVQLSVSLDRHKAHPRSSYRLGDRFRVDVVVLVRLHQGITYRAAIRRTS